MIITCWLLQPCLKGDYGWSVFMISHDHLLQHGKIATATLTIFIEYTLNLNLIKNILQSIFSHFMDVECFLSLKPNCVPASADLLVYMLLQTYLCSSLRVLVFFLVYFFAFLLVFLLPKASFCTSFRRSPCGQKFIIKAEFQWKLNKAKLTAIFLAFFHKFSEKKN